MKTATSHSQRLLDRKKAAKSVASGKTVAAVARQFKKTPVWVRQACCEYEVDVADVRTDRKIILMILARLIVGRHASMAAISTDPKIKKSREFVSHLAKEAQSEGIPIHAKYKR